MKVLILRFSSIGDIVLTTPVVRCLRKSHPDAVIHYATRKKYAGLLEANPYINKIITLESSLSDLITKLKAENYDAILDLHHNLRTLQIKLRLGVKSWSFNKLNLEKWLYVNFKLDRLPNKHIVDRYLETGRDIGIINDGLGLDYFIPEGKGPDFNFLPQSHRNNYAVLVIGAQHFTKQLPVNKCIELCSKISLPIIILGGPEDAGRGAEIELQANVNNLKHVFNACGKFSLHGSAGIVKEATLVFSNDTGLMHIAAAFRRTIYSIWGNTTPKFGMYPYKSTYYVWENNQLSCRPCSKIGFKKCPKKHFKCMNNLPFDFTVSEFSN